MDIKGLRTAERQVNDETRADYRALVKQYTDGVELEPLEVIKRLEAAGKTVDDLENDSQALTARRALVQRRAAATKRLEQLAAATAKYEAADAQEAARHAAEMQKLQTLYDAATALKFGERPETIDDLLRRSADPELIARSAELRATNLKLGSKLQHLRIEEQREQDSIDALEAYFRANPEPRKNHVAEFDERRHRLAINRKNLADLQRQIEPLAQQVERIHSESAALDAQMLVVD